MKTARGLRNIRQSSRCRYAEWPVSTKNANPDVLPGHFFAHGFFEGHARRINALDIRKTCLKQLFPVADSPCYQTDGLNAKMMRVGNLSARLIYDFLWGESVIWVIESVIWV